MFANVFKLQYKWERQVGIIWNDYSRPGTHQSEEWSTSWFIGILCAYRRLFGMPWTTTNMKTQCSCPSDYTRKVSIIICLWTVYFYHVACVLWHSLTTHTHTCTHAHTHTHTHTYIHTHTHTYTQRGMYLLLWLCYSKHSGDKILVGNMLLQGW